MDGTPFTLVIDALAHPAPFDADGGVPPVVATLQSADGRSDISFHPPIILCVEKDMARARGAFLVTGEGDGRVIAFERPGTAAQRGLTLPAERVCLLAAGSALPQSPVETVIEASQSVPLLPASLKGVWVPEPGAWHALLDR